MDTFKGWIASLSNGETVHETEWKEGEPSPWRLLLNRLKEENLTITQLRLQKGNTTVVAISKADGYAQAFEVHKAVITGKTRTLQGIGSVIGDKVFMTWLNDYNEVWQDVRPLDKMILHSTLQ